MNKDRNNSTEDNKLPPAKTGNASNPSADTTGSTGNQLIDEKGEKYLREAANIEDLPDENDQQDMDRSIEPGQS
jgi:hypothetical protein